MFSLSRTQGRGVARALHTPSNYQDQNYQRFIRIYSLQLRKQPIQIKMKEMFTFNYALLKSVRNQLIALADSTNIFKVVFNFNNTYENFVSLTDFLLLLLPQFIFL